MMTVEFITALFYEVDEQIGAIPKHPEAHLWPSEVVTLGLLHALKGGGNRAFYRWLTRDYRALFPQLPERTRLFRLFRTHQDWTQVFLAAPDGARHHRHLWHRVDPSHPRRPESAADRPQRRVESPLDCRRKTLSAAQSMGG
jgi:hypothetical protein